MNPIQEISKLSNQIPIEALQDINSRVTDWIAGGGNHDDPYIHQQLRYAKKLARSEGNG
ncbi:DUF6877 family protein [Sporosarcina sp. FSL W7-1349]|uniref:DUF6877 family protein n=1 Tax=Sporosarcina sp. FSL W7-1349 TaxID=2921561 RepID=UPI0030F608EE